MQVTLLFYMRNNIYKFLKKIPKGRITTYKLLGDAVGLHPRVVGSLLRKNFDKKVPCHRVVCSDGNIGGYNRGIKQKIKILESEGIKIKNGKIIDFKKKLVKI